MIREYDQEATQGKFVKQNTADLNSEILPSPRLIATSRLKSPGCSIYS